MLTFTIHNLQSLCDYLISLQQLHKVNKITLIFIDEKTVVPRNSEVCLEQWFSVRVTLLPREHFAMSRDLIGCYNWRVWG